MLAMEYELRRLGFVPSQMANIYEILKLSGGVEMAQQGTVLVTKPETVSSISRTHTGEGGDGLPSRPLVSTCAPAYVCAHTHACIHTHTHK